MSKKILIIGVNGFIGSTLSEKILATTDWEIYGMDLQCDKIQACLNHPRFHFFEGDLTIHLEWIKYHVKKCDVVLPLAAIATPSTYVSDPLKVFKLDFEANLDIIKLAVTYKTRVIFPSTSEVYGMSPDEFFDEETSNLVLGPISKQRWIYSCSKQLLDRVIYAYGIHEGLNYTIFRPFNFYGPRLDDVNKGGSRVLTQFISNIIFGKNIELVDGGAQRRCFCYIDDSIDALIRIIENKDNKASQQIINIGNPYPDSEASIRELAEALIKAFAHFPKYKEHAAKVKIIDVTSEQYYGKGYQDMTTRRPSIEKAETLLDWKPTVKLEDGLIKTLEYYLK
ncbi:MAG: bifunctional UDP-4-keto-pentose/UDP-xylose synthase [Pseudomonadota bacterium]